MRLEQLKAYPNLLNAPSKYGVRSSIYITKAGKRTLLAGKGDSAMVRERSKVQEKASWTPRWMVK
jgi:hypothetical protein